MSDGQTTDGPRWRWSLLVFAFVLVAQLWLVAAAGTDIPFQDQWDAEGRGLYPALRDGSANCVELLRPHNEHRIAWTQLLNRTLYLINGSWDPLVQLAANAVLHAAGAALLAGLLASGASGRMRWLLGAAVALFSLPLAGWHNALWGFQSQVYFAVGFALAAFALLADPVRTLPRTVLGWVAVVASMLAMGPGLLVPAALAGGLALRFRDGRARWQDAAPLLLLLATAWWLHQPVAEHAAIRAQSAGQFLAALGRLLAWPHTAQPWAALVLNLPLALLLVGRLARRRPVRAGEEPVTLLAGWALLVAVAAAWSRGGGEEFAAGVPSRYADFLLLLPLANLWSAVTLAQAATPRTRLLTAAWALFLLVGWVGLSAEVIRGIILPRARDRDAPVRLVREFQRTGDASVFAGQPRLLVPHPNPEAVRAVLQDPRMRGALPPSLQPDQPMGPLSRAVRAMLGR
ncbi:MAG TPA: hypothetical protein VG734_18655 [Lacunisphaera sp.]|nr:hypothetical protein [Lacunisphaera sp.]